MTAPRYRPLLIGIAAVAGLCVAAVAGPKFACDEPAHDFGTLENNRTVEHEFVLRNAGDEPLEITNVRTTCGCTVAKLADPTIQPGEEATLQAKLNLRGRRGPQNKTIILRTNDPEHETARLVIKGTAKEDVEVQPNFLSFGSVKGDEKQARDVRVVFHTEADVVSVKLEQPDETFTAELKPRSKRTPRERVIEVRARPDLAPGTYRGILVVETTHPGRPQVRVNVFANVMDKLRVLPKEIVVREGQVTTKRYVLVSRGTVRKFKILGITAPLQEIAAEMERLPAGDYRVTLSGVDGEKELDGEDLVIRTDVDGMSEVRIPFRIVPKDL